MTILSCVAMISCGIVVQAEENGEIAAQSSCMSLPADQQAFANGLNPANQTIFCSQFNAMQRSTAMSMAGRKNGNGNGNGNVMTPDQAVAKVAKDNNIAPSQYRSSGGGCPVK